MIIDDWSCQGQIIIVNKLIWSKMRKSSWVATPSCVVAYNINTDEYWRRAMTSSCRLLPCVYVLFIQRLRMFLLRLYGDFKKKLCTFPKYTNTVSAVQKERFSWNRVRNNTDCLETRRSVLEVSEILTL